jgi:hypothetical protein
MSPGVALRAGMSNLRSPLVGLALAGALAVAAPASAAVTQTAMTQALPSGTLAATNHGIECAAFGTGVLSVEITECYLKGRDGVSRHTPGGSDPAVGPAAARTGVFLNLPLQVYQACVSTRALLLDGTTESSTQCFG